MNVEHIVADFETCKKAHKMGLRIDTVLKWATYEEQGQYVISEKKGQHQYVLDGGYKPIDYDDFAIPAPTAEEVPLPFRIEFKYEKGYYAVRISHWKVTFDTQGGYGKSRHEIKIAPNEATARLKMAIWLIENVPEARQWYVENEYLKEAKFKQWQEANNERD